MKNILIIIISSFNLFFILYFIYDIKKNWSKLINEGGNLVVYAILAFTSMFLSTFGISDFAINSLAYNKLNYFPKKLIPATLNTEGTIPLFAMSLIYINYVECEPVTLGLLVAAQVTGSFISPFFSMKLSEKKLSCLMGVGLLIAAVLIVLNILNVIPMGGIARGLYGWKLLLGTGLLFLYGILNNFGIGSFAPTMATVYILGLNPLVAFPIMMSACTLSFVVGSVQFISKGHYARKPTLIFSVFGTCAVLFAGLIVKSINLDIIKIVVVAVLMISSYTMLRRESYNPPS